MANTFADRSLENTAERIQLKYSALFRKLLHADFNVLSISMLCMYVLLKNNCLH